MKKTHSLSPMWWRSQGKKPHSMSTWQLILLFVFAFFMLLWPPIITVVTLAFPSATSPSVDWKIATPFWVFFNGWYYYVFYRAWVQRQARLEAEKKQRTLTEFEAGGGAA
jgi:membrane protein implicated in regulation of membrane protease activity